MRFPWSRRIQLAIKPHQHKWSEVKTEQVGCQLTPAYITYKTCETCGTTIIIEGILYELPKVPTEGTTSSIQAKKSD
jgi:hypothetical protein